MKLLLSIASSVASSVALSVAANYAANMIISFSADASKKAEIEKLCSSIPCGRIWLVGAIADDEHLSLDEKLEMIKHITIERKVDLYAKRLLNFGR